MEISIGKFNKASGTVPVTFIHAGVEHKREVNACRTARGGYDAEATAARVDDVARGVEAKIKLGVITNPPPEPELPSPDPAAE